MKDFASYDGGSDREKTLDDWKREADRVALQYAGKSENDMLRAIYARAAEGKRNGTLTNDQIDAFYAQFAPVLDGGKRKRLKKIVEELKRM